MNDEFDRASKAVADYAAERGVSDTPTFRLVAALLDAQARWCLDEINGSGLSTGIMVNAHVTALANLLLNVSFNVAEKTGGDQKHIAKIILTAVKEYHARGIEPGNPNNQVVAAFHRGGKGGLQ